MPSHWIRRIALFTLVIGSMTAQVHAQVAAPSALAVIPAKSQIVVQIRGMEITPQRLGKMLSNALPDLAPAFAPQLNDLFKQGPLADRDLEAVRKDAPVFLTVGNIMEVSGDTASVATVLPITSYAAFKKTFLNDDERKSLKASTTAGVDVFQVNDSDYYLVDLKTYLVATPNEDLAIEFAKKFDSINKVIPAEQAKAFLGFDIAILVNLPTINEEYGDALDGVKTLLDLALGQLEQQGIDKAAQDQIKALVGGLVQGVRDGESLILGIDFLPEGASMQFLTTFKDDTKTSKYLASMKTTAFPALGALPVGQATYSGSFMLPEVSQMLQGAIVTPPDADEKTQKAIEAAIAKMSPSKAAITYMTSNIPAAGIEVTETPDATAIVAGQTALLKALPEGSTFMKTPLIGRPKFKEKAETAHGIDWNSAVLKIDFEKMFESQQDVPEEMRDAMKAAVVKLLGGEETKFWFGTDGKKAYRVSAPNWAIAKSILDAYFDGKTIGDNAGFQLSRKQLPAESSLVSLYETNRMVIGLWEYSTAILKNIPNLPIQELPQLKPAKGEASFIGLSFTMKPRTISGQFFVPTTAVQQIRTMFTELIGNMGL